MERREFAFTKMHGLGNNYIYVNQFDENLPEERLSEIAVKVSDVNTGIGSDGLILIAPSDRAPVKMRIFNNDGSEAKTCGNGLRCVARYAYEKGLVTGTSFQIETLAGIVDADVHPENGIARMVTIDMGEPHLTRGELPMIAGSEDDSMINEPIEVDGETLSMTGISMGNPHGVFFVDDIEKAPVLTIGPKLEEDERFPEGINVEFIEVVNETEMHFRVWERGSGVTQACGSGACAAVVAGVLNQTTARGEAVTVHLAGGDLDITWTEAGRVLMSGPADIICTGVFFLD